MRTNPDLLVELCELHIPVLLTWMATDLIPEVAPVYCGRPGILGQRAANIIQQKATHLYCFGARLDEQQVAYRYDNFAPQAEKWVWDIDPAELAKLPDTWKKGYINAEDLIPDEPAWMAWARDLYFSFRPELGGADNPDYVDPFRFVSLLSDYAQPDDIIVSGAGKAGEILCQAFRVKAGQQFLTLSTNGAMGNDIPLSIGAAIASGRRVLCVTGDGGFQLNIQELEVIRRLNLPIQFFIFSNNGYGSIRAMQKARFGNVVGADPESGFTIPKMAEIAECFGLEYQYILSMDQKLLYDGHIVGFLSPFRGQLIELMIDPDFVHYPRVATALVDLEQLLDGAAMASARGVATIPCEERTKS